MRNTPSLYLDTNRHRGRIRSAKRTLNSTVFYCRKGSEMMILAIAILLTSAAVAAVIYAAGVCLCQTATSFVNHYE